MDGHHLLPGAAPESLERAARDLAPGDLAPGARASLARVVPQEVGAVIAGAAAHGALVSLERAEDLTGVLEREARVVHPAGDLARVANLRDLNATLLPGVVHPGVVVPPGVLESPARVVTREVGPLEVHGALESLERAVLLDLIREIGAMIGQETVGRIAADLASRARVDLVLSNGMMIGRQPITLGMAPASLERVVHPEVVTGEHLHGAVLLESLERVVLDLEVEVGALTPGAAPALDGAVLASRARVVPQEVGAQAHGALVSLERAEDLTQDGAAAAPDGATPVNLERAEDLTQVGAADLARVANLRDRREDLTGELALHPGVVVVPPGVLESPARVVTREVGPLEVHGALESLERVVTREVQAGMVMAGLHHGTDRQVDGRQVASQGRVDHGIKPAS